MKPNLILERIDIIPGDLLNLRYMEVHYFFIELYDHFLTLRARFTCDEREDEEDDFTTSLRHLRYSCKRESLVAVGFNRCKYAPEGAETYCVYLEVSGVDNQYFYVPNRLEAAKLYQKLYAYIFEPCTP